MLKALSEAEAENEAQRAKSGARRIAEQQQAEALASNLLRLQHLAWLRYSNARPMVI